MAVQQTKSLEQPPAGWFVLDVMRGGGRGGDWSALMVDVDPEDLKNCACEFPALFYVDPAAWNALQNMMATRQ
jgi:hypothetical protein